MMGKSAKSDNSKPIVITNGDGETIECGGEYKSSDVLSVSLSGVSGQYLLSADGGVFTGGARYCSNSRTSSSSSTIITDGDSAVITITAGWASGYGAVNIPSPCVISKMADVPSSAPSSQPSMVLGNTAAPSSGPTDGPDTLGGAASEKLRVGQKIAFAVIVGVVGIVAGGF